MYLELIRDIIFYYLIIYVLVFIGNNYLFIRINYSTCLILYLFSIIFRAI